jgi:hypothetical protein
VPLSGRGIWMYDIAVNSLKTQIDLSYEHMLLVSVTATTQTASDSKENNRCLLWYFMVQSPFWEAQMSSANKEVPLILWNQAAHYHIRQSLLTLPILSQIDPVHDPITLLENCKIIFPSMTRSLKRSLSFAFLRKDPLCLSIWKSHGKFVDVTEDSAWISHWALNRWTPPPKKIDPIMNLRPPAH